MKKIQGIYIALCAALFFAVPADAAYSVTAYGLRPEEIQAIIISAVDPSGRGNLAKCSPLNMVLTYHIAPERVQSMMPECVVKGENGAPDKKESLPVFTALYAQIFTSRLTSDGGIRVSMRGEYIANPGSFFASYTFPDKHADYFEVSRYLQAYFTGGTGSGMRLSFTRGGVYVSSVLEGSSAWNAGVRTGHRLLQINRTPAHKLFSGPLARKYTWSTEYGKPFTADFQSAAGKYHVALESGYIPPQIRQIQSLFPDFEPDMKHCVTKQQLNASARRWISPEEKKLQSLPKEQRSGISLSERAVVTAVEKGSRGDRAGVMCGDIVEEINLVAVKSGKDALKIINRRILKGHLVMLSLRRNGESIIVKIR